MLKHLCIAGVLGFACLLMALYGSSAWVTPLLLLCALAMLGVSRDGADLWFFGLGAVLGSGIDLAQCAVRVTVYSHPSWIGLPPFVILYWGMIGVALRHLVLLFPPVGYRPSDGLLFVTSLLLSLMANRAPTLVALVMAALALVSLFGAYRPWNAVTALTVAILGPASESLLISHGLYAFPSAHGAVLTPWLFALYACLGASCRGVLARLEELCGTTRLARP